MTNAQGSAATPIDRAGSVREFDEDFEVHPMSTLLRIAILLPATYWITGCGRPYLYDQSANDRITVNEDGTRRELLYVIIRWPGFPTGGPLSYLSERRPLPDVRSLRRFDDEAPDWRRVEVANTYVVGPLVEYARLNGINNADVMLSIHPVILGVTADGASDFASHMSGLLIRPEDLIRDTRIVQLIHAQRFPDYHEVVRALVRQDSSAWSEQMELMIEFIEPRIIDLAQPMTIEQALTYIESQEEFHHVRP